MLAEDEPKMSKAERLALAGAVAPEMRRDAERLQRRKVIKYNQQTEEVTGYTTGAEALKGVLRAIGIEFDVTGKRPKMAICTRCGKPRKVKPNAPVPKLCLDCVTPPCVDCGTKCRPQAGYGVGGKKNLRCNPCAWKARRNRVPCATCGKELGQAAAYRAQHEGYTPRCRACFFASKTHCPKGHDFSVTGKGTQGRCRECCREDNRRRRAAGLK